MPLPPCLRDHPDGCVLTLRVVPNARKDGPDGLHGDALKLRLRAPPVDGKANEALVRLLAKLCDLPRSRVVLLAGETSRDKRVLLAGLPATDAAGRLIPASDSL